ncbi:MAG: hypothetical protein JST00_27990 [Deltaproteobacteria bacterium]|nr:hypothetical protein [Deltaproteobacteria bacterium]
METKQTTTASEEPRTDAPATATACGSAPRASSLLAVRLGHGANCSSVGSVVDTLFLSAAVGGALFAALCASLATEPVTVVGARHDDGDDGEANRDAGSDAARGAGDDASVARSEVEP